MEEEEGKKRKKKEERKKIAIGKMGFPGAGPTLLSVQQVAAVRCN
jgi:hypothetical protein